MFPQPINQVLVGYLRFLLYINTIANLLSDRLFKQYQDIKQLLKQQ